MNVRDVMTPNPRTVELSDTIQDAARIMREEDTGAVPVVEEGRVVGNGVDFGEFGGAIEIVFRARQYVNYAWIKRIPPTRLTDIFLEATGAKDEVDLMEGLSNSYYHLFPYLAIQIVEAGGKKFALLDTHLTLKDPTLNAAQLDLLRRKAEAYESKGF